MIIFIINAIVGIIVGIYLLYFTYKVCVNEAKIQELKHSTGKCDDFYVRIERLERAVIDLNEEKIKGGKK